MILRPQMNIYPPGWFDVEPYCPGDFWACDMRKPVPEVELIEVVLDKGDPMARVNTSIMPLSIFTHFKVALIPEPPQVTK